jgi:hypothetical protein
MPARVKNKASNKNKKNKNKKQIFGQCVISQPTSYNKLSPKEKLHLLYRSSKHIEACPICIYLIK